MLEGLKYHWLKENGSFRDELNLW